MNTQIRPINQTTFNILYFKYKIYFVPTGALIVAVLLLFNVIFPQIQQWYAQQEQIVQIEGKIDELNQSINTIKNIETKSLDTNLQMVTSALPGVKDFVGILNAVSEAAGESGTSLGDYAFQVGDLSNTKIPKDTFLQINVTINGNTDHIRQFISSLRNQFPISRVIEVHINGNKTASVTILFYYKPIPPITFTADQTLQQLTSKEQATLATLRRFNTQDLNTIPASGATESGRLQ